MASQKPQVVPKMPPVASQTPHVAYQLWPPRTLNLSLRLPKLPLSPKEHPLLPCRCLMWPPRWLKWPYRRPKLPFRHQANCLRDFPFGVPKLSLGHPKWPFLPPKLQHIHHSDMFLPQKLHRRSSRHPCIS